MGIIFSLTNLRASAPVALTITNFNHSGITVVIGWTAETNSFTNVFFNVQKTMNLNSNFTVLASVSENGALVYMDSASAAVAAFYRVAESNAFTALNQPGAFAAYGAGNVDGLSTIGYGGAVFDGRFVYFVPFLDGSSYHGRVLRYDTQSGFANAPSWSAFDAGNINGLGTQGYQGGAFDGRYIYFSPCYNGTVPGGKVLRLDTTTNFTAVASWNAFDASHVDGLASYGFLGAVFDGRFVYFVPYFNGSTYSGIVLRYDTRGNFTDTNSWHAYNAGGTSGLNTKGYASGVFDGRYVYFVPSYDGSSYQGRVLRYDTQMVFTNTGSWSAYDAGSTSGLNTKGFFGGVFDGRYIYFVPLYDGSSYHGRVLRYDTQSPFGNTGSWSAFDAGNTSSLNTVGYGGAVFDGRFVYFVPYYNGKAFHGAVLRYNTQSAFANTASWSAIDASNVNGLATRGYEGAVFDGRFIYFAPYYNDTASANVLRFDAKLPRAIPATVSGGSNF